MTIALHQPLLSPRSSRIAPAPVAVLRRRITALRAEGRDIIDMSSGELDFATPDHVIAAAHAAALRGETHYTSTDGSPEMKDAVRTALARDHGLSFDREEIAICNGSIQALYNALLATLAPGDEVIVPTPYWAPYLDQVRLADGVPVTVVCPQNNGFRLRPEDLAAAITPRTRWLILNNPVNPTGAVYSEADIAALAAVLRDHPRVGVIADGLYEQIVYDGGHAPTFAAAAPQLRARILTVGGVAKAYAMTGWRIGYVAGDAAVIAEIAKIQSLTTSCASSIGQAAAIAALTGPQDLLRARAAELQARRDTFVDLINRCEGLACTAPDGAFYLFASCAGLIGRTTPDGRRLASDRDVAAWLLDAAGVAVHPGSDNGLSPYIRMSFGYTLPVLAAAGARLAGACAQLR
ncbi:pyridoxal phosphate-dependent aminotransferase [Bradyrhizobium sp. U87765 SZCCT0131]|uniref:pyridoxal phosphate-dependent aminotransferase n=1 Tax=unclassified Bradyrhizobium TaxID=2631580 RepID=UPI001BA4DFF4|nr:MULTISPECIES: pyridoxal phosphate-dependent aminotransferase [unclassified Bradyrhizobium]MBR1221189.1 pyridoxal phosphate-dependent aminotransferase [Bradyrhizobium sp. U87765 SZCCT0131]MBR1259990.1 pyridoxal phosphate-dependent aminotransferase [Bradyrhizobium sp. U87765 SZCCT0134]MBR1307761.1 pyridoxal phosphate-dependent aminotransferase [Bradyrhizobium sp. U87765 SZCCT0110]MBR1321715.1 pyridoxal phosphate-dependent aminotransferase [Bradyrhizobium sp. U87765 SZCCT0109]MBR1350027.1 pyri